MRRLAHGSWWVGLLMLVVAAPAAWPAGVAGKVLFATGRADIVDAAGATRPMERGEAVRVGDELVTGQGRAQIRLGDGSSYALEPFTRFRVDEYRYEAGLAARARRAIFSLLKGGFRTITGAVGTRQEDNYRVRTQLADIGIRGTIYRAGLAIDAEGKASRLDVAVTRGRVFLTNDAGVLDIPPGQSGFATSRDVPPRISPLAGLPAAGMRGDRDGSGILPDVPEGRPPPVHPMPDHSPEPVYVPEPPQHDHYY